MDNYTLYKCTVVLPVVTRFLCPPEIPLNISSPTMVSAQTSKPKICHCLKSKHANNIQYDFQWNFIMCLHIHGARE